MGKLWQPSKVCKPSQPKGTQIFSEVWTHWRSTNSKRGSDTIGVQRNSTWLDFIRFGIRQRPWRSGWLPPTQTSADLPHAKSQHHSRGGQANPAHESMTTIPTQGTSNRNFVIAPSNMKRSPRSDNLQALQGNETQFRPIVPARRTSLTKASTSLTHASNDPTPHWREQLQPVMQFRSHYKFGSHQPPVEINFDQGVIQPGQS